MGLVRNNYTLNQQGQTASEICFRSRDEYSQLLTFSFVGLSRLTSGHGIKETVRDIVVEWNVQFVEGAQRIHPKSQLVL